MKVSDNECPSRHDTRQKNYLWMYLYICRSNWTSIFFVYTCILVKLLSGGFKEENVHQILSLQCTKSCSSMILVVGKKGCTEPWSLIVHLDLLRSMLWAKSHNSCKRYVFEGLLKLGSPILLESIDFRWSKNLGVGANRQLGEMGQDDEYHNNNGFLLLLWMCNTLAIFLNMKLNITHTMNVIFLMFP